MTNQLHCHRTSLISPLNFLFWGYVKYRVYEIFVSDLAILHGWLVAVLQTVDVAMLQRVWMELEYRLEILLAIRGACGI